MDGAHRKNSGVVDQNIDSTGLPGRLDETVQIRVLRYIALNGPDISFRFGNNPVQKVLSSPDAAPIPVPPPVMMAVLLFSRIPILRFLNAVATGTK
jgi:hypothetical protein